MGAKKKFLIILLGFISISGCKENIITECKTADIPAPVLTSFNDIQKNILNETCALAGCHAGPSPQAGLLLTSGNSYSNLVNVKSVLNPNFNRVEPGNSLNSFLIKMLKNTGEGTSLMPPTGRLSNAQIDSISAWIDRGAINN